MAAGQSEDTHGNKIIYDYQIDSSDATLDNVVMPFNPSYALTSVSWAYDGALAADPLGTVYRTGNPRYQVWFNNQTAVSRNSGLTAGVDASWDFPRPNNSLNWLEETPHELYRLDRIKVVSKQASASDYQLVRGYTLTYADSLHSLQTDDYSGQKVLTLTGIERLDENENVLYLNGAASPQPFSTTFTYNTDPGANTNTRPAGFNRMATIDNGQGGKLTFMYEHAFIENSTDPAYAPPTSEWWLYRNIYRVTQALAQDLTGTGKNTLTTYTYDKPAVNDYNHAATVIYAQYPPSGNPDSREYLARQEKHEFRGHAQVIETHYDGATTSAAKLQEVWHWFYQGGAGCLPTITGGQVSESDACFQLMVPSESWKGRELQTEIRNASAAQPLQRTIHTFGRTALPFYGDASSAVASGNYKRVGLWRAFNYETQQELTTLEGGSSGPVKTTKYTYQPTYFDAVLNQTLTYQSDQYGNGVQYGNLTRVEEYDRGTLIRISEHNFITVDASGSYIVDRESQAPVRDAQRRLLALSNTFYDALNTTQGALGTIGDVTRVATYFNVPLQTSTLVNGLVLNAHDMTATYDGYGNRLTQTTYASPGTRSYNGTITYSQPGSSSAARTSTTGYDGTFHAFPTSFSNALSQSETAGYDYRMGTLTSVTDANAATTTASYDTFGRLTAVIKPGDSASYPTVQAIYGDTEQPFRYQVAQREQAGTGNVRYTQSFYDGLGRKIQTKQEGPGGWQNIVTDTRYDGLSRATQQSQPRYSNEDSASFWRYTAPDANLFNPTSTTYDALSRSLDVTAPDSTVTQTRYWVGSQGPAMGKYDANHHLTAYESDALGRLRWVYEYQGNNGSEGGYANPAVTSYTYSPLDLLTSVSDANGNVTSIGYDTMGRKTSMSDPDMGAWSYSYNVNGTLASQTDAKSQTISFGYDNLDRLTSKAMPGSQVAYYAYDETSASNKGIGHRTSMATTLNGTSQSYERWEYDARGRTTLAGQSILGTTQDLLTSYDSADRVTSLNYYEAGEIVNYSYDAGWNPYNACSTIVGQACYVSSATATALSQPDAWTFGNGLIQDWSYSSPMQRLNTLTVGPGLFTRNYTYDNVGNVQSITDPQWPQTQHFTYDERDRLKHAWTTATTAFAPAMPALAQRQNAPSYPALTNDLSGAAEARGAPIQPGGSGNVLLSPLAQSGTRIKDITFEGGLLDATTGVDSTSGTVNLETTAPLKDAKSATIPNNATGYLAESFAGTNDLYVSLYLKASSFPASARVVQIRNGSTTVGTLTLNTNGTLTLKNSVSSATIGSSAALSTNTLYRIGIRQSSGSGTGVLQAYLATGDAAFGSAFATSSAEMISGQASEIRIGATNSSAVDATVDDIRLDTAAMPGPSGSGGATATPTNTPVGPTNTPTSTATPTNTPSGPTSTPTNTATPASGARIKDITFEGGSLTDPTTGADSTSGTVNLATGAPLKGVYSATVPISATGYLAESFSSVTDLYISFYLKASSFPATARLLQIRDSAGTTIGGLYLNSNGTLALKNVATSTTIGTSAALSTNTLYRVGIRQASGSGTGVLQAYLATGDAAFGAAFASSSAETIGNPAAEVRIGATNSTAVDATVDDIQLDSAAMPGPSAGGGATATPSLTPTGPTATPTRTATPTNTPVGPTNTPTATSTPVPAPPDYNETYTYDAIGNMTSKAGVNYTYGPTNSGPQQLRTFGSYTLSYDANGNISGGAGWTLGWDAQNLLTSATTTGLSESYTYDADGERVAKTVSGTPPVTTVYFQGIWEQTVGGASKLYYTFNGTVVAMRDTGTNTLTYLHSDHLGSVSLATNSSGVKVGQQDFDPWGAVRSGGIGATSLNYTGQRLDGTGMLYYHARYYSPTLARFISADSVVPGNVSGGMDGVALKGLTVDFHETGFVGQIAGENGQPFWFQMSDEQRQQAGSPWGPANPQALNRYSYVQNNPLGATDPSGHCIWDACIVEIAVIVVLVGGALVAVASSPNSGMRMGDYDWTDWSISDTRANASSGDESGSTVLESRYAGDKRTAGEVINNEKKGGINSQFPSEYKDKTPDQIYKDAKAGNKRAQTAKKLLDSKEYDKNSKR